MPNPSAPRLLPSAWILVPVLGLLGFIAWLQLSDGSGDEGMNNVFSYVATLAAAVLYGAWFFARSGQSPLVRLWALTIVSLLIAGALLTLRLDGVTGSMIPDVRWRWDRDEAPRLETGRALPASDAPVDLVATTPTDFPGFLGPERTGVVTSVQLARDWSATSPKELWRVPVGAGWSGFAVVNGVAVTQEQRDGEEFVVARDAKSGEELWRTGYGGGFDHVLGGSGPRATPTIDEGLVYTQGARGLLLCLEGTNGQVVWQVNLKALYEVSDALEAEKVQYGRSGSPLVHGELVIVPAGGNPEGRRAGLVAFDKRTGELRWEGPPRFLSHSSPNVARLCGFEQLLVVNEDTVSGHDPADGRMLWEHPWLGTTAANANNSQPVPVPPDGVLVSKGYAQGSSLLRLAVDEEGNWNVEAVWAQRRSLRTKLTSPVVRAGHAFALSDGILECVSLTDGARVWKDGRYGHGQLLLVDDLLLVLSEEGELLLIEAAPERENEVLGRLPVLEGKTWNTFALYGDVALVRNAREASAWRLPLRAD